MRELTGDPVYEMLERKYPRLLLDYVLLGFDGNDQGESAHKRAAAEAIGVLNTRTRVGNSLKHPWFTVDEANMRCVKWDAEDFFFEGNNGWYSVPGAPPPKYPFPGMNYWLAFMDPPYGPEYKREDFRELNEALFPAGRDGLEIYGWNDAFSNYFDDGKDWWGTAFWSVYDSGLRRFVVIGASLSD